MSADIASLAIGTALSVGLMVASYFITPKVKRSKSKQMDLTLPNLASQGSYVPLVIGRRRVPATIAWVGDRYLHTSSSGGGGKGGGGVEGPSEQTYYETAWHLICVGPAARLHRIWADGKVIFDTRIDAVNDPSGSSFTTLEGDTFTIYWGENDQPTNAFLGDESRVGVESAWPHMCYVVHQAALGSSPRWRQYDYDIECGDPSVEWPDEDASFTPISFTVNGVGDVGYEPWLFDRRDAIIKWSSPQSLSDSYAFAVASAGWYGLRPSVDAYIQCIGAIYGDPYYWPTTFTNIALKINGETVFSEAGPITIGADPYPDGWTAGSIPGAYPGIGYASTFAQSPRITALAPEGAAAAAVYLPAAGSYNITIEATVAWDMTGSDHTSVNRAYIKGVLTLVKFAEQPPDYVVTPWGDAVQQIIGDTYPHGAGFDLADIDTTQIQAISDALDDEGLTDWSVLATEGQEAGEVVGTLLQDAGAMWVRDYTAITPETFRLVRDAADPLPDLGSDMILPAETEIEIIHAERPADRVMFSFPDRDRAYRETVIAINDDGQPLDSGNVRGQSSPIAHVNTFTLAAIIAERRSQEELGDGAKITVYAGRDARLLLPGQAITVYGVDSVLRVVEVEVVDSLSSKTKIVCIKDHYGAPAVSRSRPDEDAGESSSGSAEANLAETFIEIPEHVNDSGAVRIAALRLRANNQIAYQTIYASIDGTTYKRLGLDSAQMAGGELTEALAATDAHEIEDGPTFDVLGPDIDLVEDLTADEAAWRRGQQICVIGDEIFFLRSVEALGGDSYRLKGLIRARYDTKRAAHAIGAHVFIVSDSGLVTFGDAMLFPGESLRIKQQPVASGALALADVTATTKTLYGKGLVPPKPVGLRVTAPLRGVAGYATGEDVTFEWASRLADPAISGAGMQPAGTAVAEVIGQRTAFEIKVYDATDTLVRTEERSLPMWTYANADLQTDLGGETDFRVEIREFVMGGGFIGDPIEMEVVAL